MKKLYIIFYGVLLTFAPFQKNFSQCLCADGSKPDSLAYEQYFDSIIATNTIISFPQFDPTMGELRCIKISDTVTTVVNYNLENDLGVVEDYNFETFRRSQFTGPGGFFASMTSPPKDFGPYTLQPKDSLGDNIDIGPDTTFDKRYHEQYASSNPAFYGTGTVDFNYLTTSTFTILTGSDNAIFKLRAYTRLDVTLTYYWCPSLVLATHISNFSAALKDNNVLLQWQVNDPVPTGNYEIEVSTDGKTFKSAGNGHSVMSGGIEKYDFLYGLYQNFPAKLFFRIKETDYAGKNSFSEIKSVTINKNNSSATYSLYPNPTISGINIQFAKNTSGDYEVQLINAIGQSIFQKKYAAQNGSINIEWSQKPLPGIYYLRVKDLKSNLEETSKLRVM